MANSTTRIVEIPDELSAVCVLGVADASLREIEHAFPQAEISVHGSNVHVVARSARAQVDASQAEDVLRKLIDAAYDRPLSVHEVRRMLERRVLRNVEHDKNVNTVGHGGGIIADPRVSERKLMQDTQAFAPGVSRRCLNFPKGVITYASGAPVRAKTGGQIKYVQAIATHTITFGIGPAGTGKTYLAVAQAVRALQEGRIHRIILTRPAVEAGESLGFLPGTLHEKVDPYLRPLYDALNEMLSPAQLKRYLDDGTVEVAPLAYMRGRTLNDAFVILDEAQNTTAQQLKMFLTRLGFNTTMVITGDKTQVDLTIPHSGLATIESILRDVSDVAFVHLQANDVVRHELVAHIVEAYERYDERNAYRSKSGQPVPEKHHERAYSINEKSDDEC